MLNEEALNKQPAQDKQYKQLSSGKMLSLVFLALGATFAGGVLGLVAVGAFNGDEGGVLVIFGLPVICSLFATHAALKHDYSEADVRKGMIVSTLIGSIIPVAIAATWLIGFVSSQN